MQRPPSNSPETLTPEQIAQQQQQSRDIERLRWIEARNRAYPHVTGFRKLRNDEVPGAVNTDAPGAAALISQNAGHASPGYYKTDKRYPQTKEKCIVEIMRGQDGNLAYRPVISPPPTPEKRLAGLDAAMDLAKKNGAIEVVYDINQAKYADWREIEYVLKSARERGLKVDFGQNVQNAFKLPNDHPTLELPYESGKKLFTSPNDLKDDIRDIDKNHIPIARDFENSNEGFKEKLAVFARLTATKERNNSFLDAQMGVPVQGQPARPRADANATPPVSGAQPAVQPPSPSSPSPGGIRSGS